jgi:superfamily I DNA and/or RNA helicase
VQFRMHPEISKFPSTQFYWKKLENDKSVMQRDDGLKEFRSLFKKRVNFLDLQDNYEQKDFKSTQNLGEAK